MRIILHAGFHKTGTSSLQVTLEAHRQALAPFAHVETRQGNRHLSRACDAARSFCVNGNTAALRSGMEAWVARLPSLGERHLLVSSEDFVGHMPGRFGVRDYRAALTTLPAAVAALQARFPHAAVQVFLSTRAAKPWLKSLHWQVALHPDLTLKQRRFCKEYASAADFGAVLIPLAQALGGRAEVSHADLDSLTGRRLGLVEAIYDLCGLPDALRMKLPATHAHIRRSIEGLADQFVMLNRAKLPREELDRAKRAMRDVMQALEEGEG